MIRKNLLQIFLLTLASTSFSCFAGQGDDFGDCYQTLKGQTKSKPSHNELFVIIDQTVKFDNYHKSMVREKIRDYFDAGKKVTMVTFSTYQNGHYTKRLLSGSLDIPLTEHERYVVSKSLLRRFDSCLIKQKMVALQQIDQSLVKAFDGADSKLPNSEIVENLYRISKGLISKSSAPEKSVLVVSDMIENSKKLSFYKHGQIQLKDANRAITVVKGANLMPFFDKASIYVLGAGFGAKRFNDPNTVNNIKTFWDEYFKLGDATLNGWGQPELFEQIQ